MGRRKLLKQEEWEKVFGIPDDEVSLIRHYTLTPEDRQEIETRRRSHNQLGYAVQLCLMRYPGRTLMPGEQLPSSVAGYISEQLAVDREDLDHYSQREPTRLEHTASLSAYLKMRTAKGADRRTVLLAAIEAAAATDKGLPIVDAVVAAFRATMSCYRRRIPLNVSASPDGPLPGGLPKLRYCQSFRQNSLSNLTAFSRSIL